MIVSEHSSFTFLQSLSLAKDRGIHLTQPSLAKPPPPAAATTTTRTKEEESSKFLCLPFSEHLHTNQSAQKVRTFVRSFKSDPFSNQQNERTNNATPRISTKHCRRCDWISIPHRGPNSLVVVVYAKYAIAHPYPLAQDCCGRQEQWYYY
jgi:hypothetical protein